MPERERPLSRMVINSVRSEINAGLYSDGALPTINKLAERFGVSRVTMRHALKYLETEGLLFMRQGSGTFVNVPGESQESQLRRIRSSRSELPRSVDVALGRYLRFMSNSQIPEEIRLRTMQVIDAQISLIEQSQQPTPNPK